MQITSERLGWIELIVFSGLTVFLFIFSGLLLTNYAIMLLPMQVLFVRRGKSFLLPALALAFIAITVVVFMSGNAGLSVEAGQDWTSQESIRRGLVANKAGILFFIAALFAGFLFLNLHPPGKGGRLAEVLTVTGCSTLLGILLFLYLRSHPALMDDIGFFIDGQVNAFLGRLRAPELEKYKNTIMAVSASDKIWSILSTVFCLYYFLTLVPGWWLGSLLAAKLFRLPFREGGIGNFRVPAGMGWALLVTIGLLVLQVFINGYFWILLLFNILLVLLLVYGVQGLSVIRFLLSRTGLPAGLIRFWPLILIGVMMLVPGFFVFCLIIIPVIGISEIWFRYRGPLNPAEGKESPPEDR